MNKWFKKYLPSSKSMQNSRQIQALRSYFKAKHFFSRDEESVARGVAAGLAGAVIPGFQIFYAAILVLLLRGNLPIALLFTLVSNPFTGLPIIYFIYYVGSLILGNSHKEFVVQQFQWDFSSLHAFWSNVAVWTLQFGKAFLVGVPIVSVCVGVLGYFGTKLIWKLSRMLRKKR